MSTESDLKAAFAGESQANRKYIAFAKKADADGFPQVAKLFRLHPRPRPSMPSRTSGCLAAVKTTAENLAAAIDGETYESRRCIRLAGRRPEREQQGRPEHL